MPTYEPTLIYNPRATDQKLLAWSFDPVMCAGGSVMTGGVLYVARIPVPLSISVTNVLYAVATAATGATSGQCFAALYDSSGTRIGVSADQSTNFGSTGLKTAALASGPFSITGGAGVFVYGALLSNAATTQMSPQRGASGSAGLSVAGQVAADGFRFGTSGTSQTAAPSSFTVSALSSAAAIPMWIGLS